VRRPSNDMVNKLLPLIYESIGDPEGWRRFLTSFADAVSGTTTILFAQNLRSDVGRVRLSIRWDPGWELKHDEYFSRRNPWIEGGKHLIRPGAVLSGPMCCRDDDVRKTDYYHDFLRPQGVLHQIGACLLHEAGWDAILTTVRSERDIPFGDDELQLLRVLVPHLQRALQLHRRLERADCAGTSADEALQRIGLGVIVLAKEGRVPLFVSNQARRICDAGDGLKLTENGLAAADRREHQVLQKLVWDASRTTLGDVHTPGGAIAISRPSEKPAYRVLVAPSPRGRYTLFGGSEEVMVFVDDPADPKTLNAETISRLYRLTPAEGRLVALLCAGNTLRDAAGTLDISFETARSRLKDVFLKTGTGRQATLVALVNSFPPLTHGKDS
jgi:DNA-binding CsgD family transcriptional regulator